jgi:putative transposase
MIELAGEDAWTRAAREHSLTEGHDPRKPTSFSRGMKGSLRFPSCVLNEEWILLLSNRYSMRAFVYKLRPTRAQRARLEETLETCRWLYNVALAERKGAWEHAQRSVIFAQQSAELPPMKQILPFLWNVRSMVLQDVLHRVEHSFESFFRRCQTGEKPGYPRFKGAGWYDSFTYPQWGNGVKLRDGRLFLSKIGRVRLCKDRAFWGKPKTCSLVRRADGWYACIVCEIAPCPFPETGQEIGVDLGIEAFATLSNGERIENPRLYHRAQKQLRQAQRRLARRQKGSHRRRKAGVLLAKAHLKVKRARLDFCHKTALDLIERFDVIHVEKLNIRGMVRNHPLAKAISDAGWGLFLSVLRAKAASAGRVVVEVNPAGTSQTCSGCGAYVPKRLNERWHACPCCELSLHRDENAAIRVLQVGGGTAVGR